MRLKSIKLAGFKSFVDPTTVNFPNNLSAVVGPNGCGKSNVIDAVRWVMGESSAKHLRGESMTDVIFNGSNARKPTTQASVELVFDNSDRTLVGEYAGYSEIAIKRLVTREAQSYYYLNGAKCRRKDITDIFLGTGLGPRSYAIIEQGMITRLIEAKPEELRVFIEEAAGISKYKERRRETENRMKRTRENLERLEDIREELGRQLQHLQRQAQAAEKYKQYKQEERLLGAQLQALRWQSVDLGVKDYETRIGELEVNFEARIAEQRAADAEIEKQRVLHTEVNDALNQVQSRFYALGTDIARIEQSIQHQQERGEQLQEDLQASQQACQETESQLHMDQSQAEQLELRLQQLEPDLELVQARAEESAAALAEIEETVRLWQSQWDEFNQAANKPREAAQVEQSKIQQYEQSIERLRDRIERLELEQTSLSLGPLETEVAQLEEQADNAEQLLESRQLRVTEINQRITEQRQHNNQLGQRLDQQKSELSSLKGRYASLQALQQAAMGEADNADWLTEQGLADKPRLATLIKAVPGWEQAIETVLSDYLQALCINDLDAVADLAADLQQGSVSLIESGSGAIATSPATGLTLAPISHYLQAESAELDQLQGLLGVIYAAEDLTGALQQRQHLRAGESIVTREGLWLGGNWLRVIREDNPQSGVLKRQQEIQQLEARLEQIDASIEVCDNELLEGRDQLHEAEQSRDDAQREVTEASRSSSAIKADLSAKQVRLEQFLMRRDRIGKELQECQQQQQQEQQAVGESRKALQAAVELMAADTDKRELLQVEREQNHERLDAARQASRQDKDKAHQLALEVRSLTAQAKSARQGAERLQGQLDNLQQRCNQIQDQLSQGDNPVVELRAELEEKLEQRLTVEEELIAERRQLETCAQALRHCEQQRSQAEQAAQQLRSDLEQNRMQWQGLQVQRTNLVDKLKEQEFDLQSVLQDLPEGSNENQCQQALEKIGGRISRLGAINLAAIEEYQQQSERKTYLDSQHNDLIEALETLESAIRKIDRETRTRFQETFDQVNSGLQKLFPIVFGGGHAYLEMTGEDLLDTGVAIMARPPGKRNSTIHLLSGGEKALTAIALVFSIFELNPAPFCMLDEVDAPLDDANVGRYSRMVEQMSEHVQFIYITHNKIAMEMAHQLMGVTMHEPGVSRLVSVDVEEAAAMAAV